MDKAYEYVIKWLKRDIGNLTYGLERINYLVKKIEELTNEGEINRIRTYVILLQEWFKIIDGIQMLINSDIQMLE